MSKKLLVISGKKLISKGPAAEIHGIEGKC